MSTGKVIPVRTTAVFWGGWVTAAVEPADSVSDQARSRIIIRTGDGFQGGSSVNGQPVQGDNGPLLDLDIQGNWEADALSEAFRWIADRLDEGRDALKWAGAAR